MFILNFILGQTVLSELMEPLSTTAKEACHLRSPASPPIRSETHLSYDYSTLTLTFALCAETVVVT